MTLHTQYTTPESELLALQWEADFLQGTNKGDGGQSKNDPLTDPDTNPAI